MASAVKKRSKSKTGRPVKQARRTTRIDHQKDGSIRAKGTTRGGKLDGYWEWFRLDGTVMRSGHFENGRQVGQWATYDLKGKVYKVTRFK